jgi:hypothetical protein
VREQELLSRFRELPEHDQDRAFAYIYRLLGRPEAMPPWASGELKRTWAAITRLTPVQFEDFVGLLLCADGYRFAPQHREARHHGLDLLLRRGRERYGVLCKLRTVKDVGLSDVNRLASLARAQGLRRGIIVTNAGFTGEARQRVIALASPPADPSRVGRRRRGGLHIELVDSRRIHVWLHDPKYGHAREFLSSPRSPMWQAVLAGYGKRRRVERSA